MGIPADFGASESGQPPKRRQQVNSNLAMCDYVNIDGAVFMQYSAPRTPPPSLLIVWLHKLTQLRSHSIIQKIRQLQRGEPLIVPFATSFLAAVGGGSSTFSMKLPDTAAATAVNPSSGTQSPACLSPRAHKQSTSNFTSAQAKAAPRVPALSDPSLTSTQRLLRLWLKHSKGNSEVALANAHTSMRAFFRELLGPPVGDVDYVSVSDCELLYELLSENRGTSLKFGHGVATILLLTTTPHAESRIPFLQLFLSWAHYWLSGGSAPSENCKQYVSTLEFDALLRVATELLALPATTPNRCTDTSFSQR